MNRFISLGEIRLGLLLIVKQPILSATVVLALATGICLATMGFTFRDELLNSTLPYRAGERMARLEAFNRDGQRLDIDLERYQAFRDRAQTFAHVGAVAGRPFTITHRPGEVETVTGALLTPRSMTWLDASPLAGRTLIEADGESGAEPVVLIRESLWRRRYSADPNILGRAISIGAQSRTVVGIMPDSVAFPNSGELWLPLDESAFDEIDGVRVFGVLKPDVAFESATTEIELLSARLTRKAPPEDVDRVRVQPFTEFPGEAGVAVTALVFVLVMVLLVVASNVATLVYARTWSRAPELAVRTALGAARSRVVGQLFAETLLLGSFAAAIGTAGAYAVLRYIRGSFEGWPFWMTLDPNPRVLAFVVVLTLLVSAVSGLIPALRVTRHDLRSALQAGRGFAFGGFGRTGAALLVVEVALSVALLNGAVTMARAFAASIDEVPALPKNQVLTAQLGRIPDPEARDEVVAAARALPGVVAAGAGPVLPRLYPPSRRTAVEPIGDEPATAPQTAPGYAVGEGFLEAIGATVVAGRLFTASDFIGGAAPVAVVNEPFVNKFLGGRHPIGRRIRIEDPGPARRHPGARSSGSFPIWG